MRRIDEAQARRLPKKTILLACSAEYLMRAKRLHPWLRELQSIQNGWNWAGFHRRPVLVLEHPGGGWDYPAHKMAALLEAEDQGRVVVNVFHVDFFQDPPGPSFPVPLQTR